MGNGLVLAAVIAILLVYLICKNAIKNNYWRVRGIPTAKGELPFIGHVFSIFWSCKSMASFCDAVYAANKGRSVVGFFQFRKPSLMLLDPELVKTVLISDFGKFSDNVLSVDEKIDGLLAHNPFFSAGEKWKTSRSRLSSALMSSRKLKILCDSVTRVCDKFVKYLHENIEKSESGVFEVEAKEMCNRFTGEVVARTGFGVEGDFFDNGSGPDSFRETVLGFFDAVLFETIKQTILFLLPSLNAMLGLRFLPPKIDRLFRRLVHDIICIRQRDGKARNDFLQMMMENRKLKDNGEIDEETITADVTSLFLDGYETSAITMAFFAHQLAENPSVQDKLRDEVKTVLDKHDGEINYDSLGEMTYMDRALNESMRLQPALGSMVRICNERCKLVGKDGVECIVEPGMELMIPIRALQNDSDYWENPEAYDPERFNEENRKKRPKTVFLPFGEGPRICVGMRFATMQIKGAIATIVKDFVIESSPKTKRPLAYKRSAILTAIEGGLWVNLKPL